MIEPDWYCVCGFRCCSDETYCINCKRDRPKCGGKDPKPKKKKRGR